MENKICGRYVTYPKNIPDTEGGLRISQGTVKRGTAEKPLITYITVVYNRAETMLRCMESIWNQSYPNIEYIIVDGASTDGTLELIKQHADKIDYFISQPDHGIYDAMNKGISLAKGQYICFMNSDDACVEEAAKTVANVYQRTHADIVCGTRKLYVGGVLQKEITYPRYCIKNSVFRYIQMYHQATYASADVFNSIGDFDLKYSLLSDWIWESKAIDHDFSIRFIEEQLAVFNYDGASFKGIVKRDEEWIEWIMETFPDITKMDAEVLLFALDRERQPFYQLKPLNQVAKKYQSDQKFSKLYYETALLSCIEDSINCIKFYEENPKYNTDRYLPKRGLKTAPVVKSFQDLQEELQKELSRSCSENNCQNQWSLKELEIIRKSIIQTLYKQRLKSNYNKVGKQLIRMIVGMGQQFVGIIVGTAYQTLGLFYQIFSLKYIWHKGKTVAGIHTFYLKMRERWDVDKK